MEKDRNKPKQPVSIWLISPSARAMVRLRRPGKEVLCPSSGAAAPGELLLKVLQWAMVDPLFIPFQGPGPSWPQAFQCPCRDQVRSAHLQPRGLLEVDAETRPQSFWSPRTCVSIICLGVAGPRTTLHERWFGYKHETGAGDCAEDLLGKSSLPIRRHKRRWPPSSSGPLVMIETFFYLLCLPQ